MWDEQRQRSYFKKYVYIGGSSMHKTPNFSLAPHAKKMLKTHIWKKAGRVDIDLSN